MGAMATRRRAYARAAVEFFDWLAARGVTRRAAIESVTTAQVKAAVNETSRPPHSPEVKRKATQAASGGTFGNKGGL
jgi:hypothetical protein